MRQFYELFPSLQIAPRPVAHVEKDSVFGENKITQQVVAQIKNGSIPGVNVILQQVAAQFGNGPIARKPSFWKQVVSEIGNGGILKSFELVNKLLTKLTIALKGSSMTPNNSSIKVGCLLLMERIPHKADCEKGGRTKTFLLSKITVMNKPESSFGPPFALYKVWARWFRPIPPPLKKGTEEI